MAAELEGIEVQEVECPRRACTRNDSGICALYGPEDGDFYACRHARIREGYIKVEISDDGQNWRPAEIDPGKTDPATADVKEGQFIRLETGAVLKVFREHNLPWHEEHLAAYTRETAEKRRGHKW